MMHLHLLVPFATDATRHSQFRAGSESNESSHNVSAVLVSHLEGQFVFSPVLVLVEANPMIGLPSVAFDEDRKFFPKAPENL